MGPIERISERTLSKICSENRFVKPVERPMSVGNVQTGATWCVNWDMPLLKSGWSCKSSQPACSQFCDELAASEVDAVTAMHAIASEPAGRSWLHCFADAVVSRYCQSELHAVGKKIKFLKLYLIKYYYLLLFNLFFNLNYFFLNFSL